MGYDGRAVEALMALWTLIYSDVRLKIILGATSTPFSAVSGDFTKPRGPKVLRDIITLALIHRIRETACMHLNGCRSSAYD